jgi:SAM-dependent methyltransferase
MASVRCLNCNGAAVETLLDFGPQPPSNRFVPVGEVVLDAHALTLGQCAECGLVQLVDPMPAAMVCSRHAWLTYAEPEQHLDALVEHLATSVGAAARIVGLTYKDDSTLARFNRLGYPQTSRCDMKSDLGIHDPCAGLEAIQAVIDDALVDRLVAKYGKADLLIARHMLEHAHDPGRCLRALGRLLAPTGRLVFEMPDCRKFIDACDYSFIWEEHISYFSPRTVADLASRNGFWTVERLVYPYPLEDSLVVIMQPAADCAPASDRNTLAQELAAGRRFAHEFNSIRLRYRNYFESLHKAGKRIAVFGAGHLAGKFLNLFGLKESVDWVIDDNPHKQGLAMPGSGLVIVGSSRLPEVDLCMLSLNPESEQKVLAKHQSYVRSGGSFASIFALSPLALKLS